MYNYMIGITIIVLGVYALIEALYIKLRAGKIILKLDEGKGGIIAFIGFTILCAINIINACKYYLEYKEKLPALKAEFLYSMLVIVICIFLCLDSTIHSDIRENGICYFYSFYSWQRIKEWRRIDENIIQLKISLFSKLSYRVKLQVSKYSIWSMIEILENHIGKEKEITFKENRAD